jgi:uncharacterized membrane protein
LVIYKKNADMQQSWAWWRWALIGLNIVALVLSAILSWHYLMGGSMVGCGGGSPCDQVLNSRWSSLGGILPVSGLAMGAYLAMLVASFYIGIETEVSIRRMAWSTMLVLVGSVAGSAIWFTALQKWVIGDFCPYCMIAHSIGLLLAILVIWRALKESYNFIKPLLVVGLVLIGLVMAGTLAVYQGNFNPSAVYQESESLDNQPVIDYHAVPIIGSPDAPYVVTLLFDYQCPHCQKIHLLLHDAVRNYAGKLAFVLCPAPLNTKCNPYIPRDVDAFRNSCELAKIGLIVWVAKREAFPEFETWMFSFESGNRWQPRKIESVREKAVELVGKQKFDAAWTNPWIEQYIQTSIQIYGRTIQSGKGGIPKLIFGSRWVIPEIYTTDELIGILQNSLGVPKP